jgi:hypothetical protein
VVINTFEVGDKVKIVRHTGHWNAEGLMDNMLGKTGIIKKIGDYGTLVLYGIPDESAIGQGKNDMWWFDKEELELVEKCVNSEKESEENNMGGSDCGCGCCESSARDVDEYKGFKVGDTIKIVRKTDQDDWNDEGLMDPMLGKTVKIAAIDAGTRLFIGLYDKDAVGNAYNDMWWFPEADVEKVE